MSIALYRRYRPDTFQDVIGQDHVVKPLMAALRSGRVSHAYLFSGPRGCGKTTSARIMARCLNCAEGPTDTPCGKCESCKDLATGGSGSLDVVEIDAASHNGVDDARELRERAGFAPVRDRFKIFILDEAHMVTQQGFNALLKIVEEPPEHVKFIFATTEPDKVIGTIRSRTHHYPFRLVPPEVMEKYMEKLCQAENIEPAAGVLQLVMRAGAGSVRDSLSVLDQLMAGAEDGKLAYGTASALLGYTDSAILERSVDAIIDRDGAALFEVIAKMVEGGHEPRRYLEDLLLRLRDLLVLSVSSVEDAQVALAGTPRDQLKVMSAQAERWGTAGISRASDLTNTALTELTGATAPRIQVELLAARLLLPPPAEQVTSGVNAVKSAGNPKSLSGAEAAMAALHRVPRPRSNPAPAPPLASAPPRNSAPELSVGQVDEIKTAEVAAAPTNSGEGSELSAPRPPLKKAEEKSLSDGGYQNAGDTSATLTPIKSPVSKRAAVAKGEQYWQVLQAWEQISSHLRQLNPRLWSTSNRRLQIGGAENNQLTLLGDSQEVVTYLQGQLEPLQECLGKTLSGDWSIKLLPGSDDSYAPDLSELLSQVKLGASSEVKPEPAGEAPDIPQAPPEEESYPPEPEDMAESASSPWIIADATPSAPAVSSEPSGLSVPEPEVATGELAAPRPLPPAEMAAPRPQTSEHSPSDRQSPLKEASQQLSPKIPQAPRPTETIDNYPTSAPRAVEPISTSDKAQLPDEPDLPDLSDPDVSVDESGGRWGVEVAKSLLGGKIVEVVKEDSDTTR